MLVSVYTDQRQMLFFRNISPTSLFICPLKHKKINNCANAFPLFTEVKEIGLEQENNSYTNKSHIYGNI